MCLSRMDSPQSYVSAHSGRGLWQACKFPRQLEIMIYKMSKSQLQTNVCELYAALRVSSLTLFIREVILIFDKSF